MSGHSKWSQIKHKKGATDAKRGQLFSKLVKEITLAAREGGTTIDANARLRAVAERARASGLPKDNIERAIARASGTGESNELFELLCEATVPGGIAIIIEAITDNKNRTINEIKHILAEHNARLNEPGSLLWNFEKIGILEVTHDMNPGLTRDRTEAAIIESGANDFEERDGVWIVETPYADRESVRRNLEAQGVIVKEATHDYKPKTTMTIEPDRKGSLLALLDMLSEHDDVQEVYTNL